jgi:hypothetical protein
VCCTCGQGRAWLVQYVLVLFLAPCAIGIALAPVVAIVLFIKRRLSHAPYPGTD